MVFKSGVKMFCLELSKRNRVQNRKLLKSVAQPILFSMTEILTLQDVASYFHAGTSTIKRWVMQARRGLGDFPLPVTPKGTHLRWRKADIEQWHSCIGNVPPELPNAAQIETPGERQRHNEKIARGLENFGITIKKKGASL